MNLTTVNEYVMLIPSTLIIVLPFATFKENTWIISLPGEYEFILEGIYEITSRPNSLLLIKLLKHDPNDRELIF